MNREQKDSRRFLCKTFLTFAVLMLITLFLGYIGLNSIKVLGMATKMNSSIIGSLLMLFFIVYSSHTIRQTVDNGNVVIASIVTLIFCSALSLTAVVVFLRLGFLIFEAIIVAGIIALITAVMAYINRSKDHRNLGQILFTVLVGYIVLIITNNLLKLHMNMGLGIVGSILFTLYFYWDFKNIYNYAWDAEIWTMTSKQQYCLILSSATHLLLDFVNLLSSFADVLSGNR